VILLADHEYKTEKTLPQFAQQFLGKDFRVSTVSWEKKDSHRFAGIDEIRSADVLLVSAWRRQPPKEQLDVIRQFVAAGKPVVGIRTATHAFARRKGWELPAGHDEWPTFDQDVLGCRYTGHHGNELKTGVATLVKVVPEASSNPLVAGLPTGEFQVPSWLYKCQPLGEKATLLVSGRAGDRKPIEPVAWTNVSSGGGKVFCTTMGHWDDFKVPAFQLLLLRGVYWSAELPIPKELPQPAAKAAARLPFFRKLEAIP
jgi:type 1 glutamine amidotransferase